jgi:gluconolactonase
MSGLFARDERFSDISGSEFRLERIATGFLFTEGPIWNHVEGHLTFSDIPGDQMHRWTPERGVFSFRQPSNKANGNTYDRQARILTCEHATSRVTRTGDGGELDVLASHYGGKELNSPNDIIVRTDGAIFFTDPTYGRMPHFGIERNVELDFRGVYMVGENARSPVLLVSDFEQPNGLCLSPDERTLYVDDTTRGHIRSFTIAADGALNGGKVWAELANHGPGAPDGLKCDTKGNVYCAGPGGIHVFAPDATCLGIFEIPEVAANFTWGGSDMKTVFVTASTSVYRFRTRIPGPVLF